MLSIAFYETKQEDEKRIAFQNQVKEAGIPRYFQWSALANKIPHVLFFHGGDQSHLRDNEALRPALDNIWLIKFGGRATEKQELGDRIIGYINYSDLSARFDAIVGEIRTSLELTKPDLENIIFGIDPDIEKLLAELCTKPPFVESWDTDSRNNRKKLIDLINQKHGMTLK